MDQVWSRRQRRGGETLPLLLFAAAALGFLFFFFSFCFYPLLSTDGEARLWELPRGKKERLREAAALISTGLTHQGWSSQGTAVGSCAVESTDGDRSRRSLLETSRSCCCCCSRRGGGEGLEEESKSLCLYFHPFPFYERVRVKKNKKQPCCAATKAAARFVSTLKHRMCLQRAPWPLSPRGICTTCPKNWSIFFESVFIPPPPIKTKGGGGGVLVDHLWLHRLTTLPAAGK